MRRHLLGVVLSTLSIVLIVFVVPVLVLLRRDGEDQAVLTAMRQAQTLAPVTQKLTERSLPSRAKDGYAVSVFMPDGRVFGVPAPRTPSVRHATDCQTSTGHVAHGFEVLLPVAGPAGCATVIRVFATDQALGANTTILTLLVLTLSAATVVVAILLAQRLAGALLDSVADLATTSDRLASGDLTARATPHGPGEIRRVGEQLNRLAIRVDFLLDQRSQHGADLTHRLRTPLTALRLDLDAIPDSPTARRLIAGHDAVNKAVDEVIRAARHTGPGHSAQHCDLVVVARDRLDFWSALADDTGRAINRNLSPNPVLVPAARAEVEATLDALLGNVFTHTPDRVPLWVTVGRERDGAAMLTVDDAGPGFPHLDVVRRGRSGAASTGLGLDIARRTAENAAGHLRISRSPRGGARVQLRLGAMDTQRGHR